MNELKKISLSCLTGFVATLTNQYALIFALVCFAIVLDCFTGLVKVKATDEKLSSQKGTKGFWKKMGFISAFGFGVFLDCFIPVALSVISIELPFSSPLGLIIGVYIVLNESISISENLIEINPNSVPQWLLDLIKSTAEKIDKEDKNEK